MGFRSHAPPAAFATSTKTSLGIQSEGGELFGGASSTHRVDGLTYWKIVLHAGTLHGARLGVPSRTVSASMTSGTGVIFEYSNAWAAPNAAAAVPDH